jgi:hypothetical protein
MPDLGWCASEFEIPSDFLPFLMKNKPDHSLYPVETIRDLVVLKIDVIGLYVPSKITAEMGSNFCISSFDDSNDGPGLLMEFGDLYESSLSLQADHKLLKLPAQKSEARVALPILRPGPEDLIQGYCVIAQSNDKSLSCESVSDEQSFPSDIMAFQDVQSNHQCIAKGIREGTNNSVLLAVPLNTKLQDFENVARSMEARGASIFDTALPTIQTQAEKPLAKPDGLPNPNATEQLSSGRICNKSAPFANLRKGPNGVLFPVVAKLATSTSVEILEQTVNPETKHPWVKISSGGITGFIDQDYVVVGTCTLGVQAANHHQDSPTEAVACSNNQDHVNVRSGSNGQNELVMELKNGEKTKKLSDAVNPISGHPWVKINANGKEGYVDADKIAATCRN